MHFFQNSVLNKHLKSQDSLAIKGAYSKFTGFFHNPDIQENIRNSKEEQYQGEFLIDLFVNILGYTKNPNPGFNLTTEYKNVKDSKKADGAILINGVVKAVIELKGTDTTDLNRIEAQAFGYKNNQPECVYVVTSNFEKLRFYIDNAIEHIEFNLFTLTEKEFELLWLCLAYVNIEKNLAKRIKDESVSQEDVITKNLYNDYSLFKRELHQNLVALNPDHDPLMLFKKSQKLLDRFLFLFFAEDRQLLPPNSVRLILDDWRDLQDRDVEIALYARFKKYFEYLNTGFKGKRYDVFAYNGGLFKTDELLDGLKIDDELLYRHTMKLSEYDFASEVDVNILGHIFENSLNELDEIKAQLEGQQVDKSKSKRKKDGVFYTPKYITKYIVDNTVGKLCAEKKAELELVEEEYTTDRKRNIKTKQPLFDKLTAYRNWLLQLTICDPACGSGAFLNQALDFLINEHRYIDELQAKLFGDAMVLSDFEKNILENNLFGVDINEESVEIAKLSLWLRTAQPNRKLNDLNNNIKCGNSLIDDPAVAGDKAFNWHNEFPSVFAKGGFDVVIGNPPYVQLSEVSSTTEHIKNYLIERYKSSMGRLNTYGFFIKLSMDLSKRNGINSYIIPNTILTQEYYKKIRFDLINESQIIEIVQFLELPFKEAVVENIILSFENTNPNIGNYVKITSSTIGKFQIEKMLLQSDFNNNFDYNFNIYEKSENDFLNFKFKQNITKLGEISEVNQAIALKGNRDFWVHKTKIEPNFVKVLEGGKNINRYSLNWGGDYLDYRREAIHSCNRIDIFESSEKIFFRRVANSLIGALDTSQLYALHTIVVINVKEEYKAKFNIKYILALFNSTAFSFYYKANFISTKTVFTEIGAQKIRELPIKNVDLDTQNPFILSVDQMILLTKELQELTQKFQRSLQRKFNLDELPGKLQNWYLLTYKEFITELAKKKVKLSLTEEAEWEAYFLQEAKQALALKSEIDKTDAEIDRMVYELYGLTEEEIRIVEGE